MYSHAPSSTSTTSSSGNDQLSPEVSSAQATTSYQGRRVKRAVPKKKLPTESTQHYERTQKRPVRSRKRLLEKAVQPSERAQKRPRTTPLVSPLNFSQWARKIPALWHSSLPITRDGRIEIPAFWHVWLHPSAFDVQPALLPREPTPELMSSKLWPAICQLLASVDVLEAKMGRPLTSEADIRTLKQSWSARDTLSDPVEIDIMLHLCRIAMANTSPLTDRQKHFLVVFIASRMAQRELKTNLFDLIRQWNPTLPVCSDFVLLEPLTKDELLGQFCHTLFSENAERIVEKFINSSIWGLADMPPENCEIKEISWKFARSFLNLWYQEHQCDLKTEFNIGDPDGGDMLNSSYFSLYMRYLFGGQTSLSDIQKADLALLLDMVISKKRVTLTMDGAPVNWRDWATSFNPDTDCLPHPPGITETVGEAGPSGIAYSPVSSLSASSSSSESSF